MDITPISSLTAKQESFALYYVQHSNAGAAYRYAYDVGPDTGAQTARSNGHQLLQHPKVRARVMELQAAAGARALMPTSELIADLEEMVNADVNEVMALHVGNCRHCRGHEWRYQWRDETEFAQATNNAMQSKGAQPMPDPLGGFGFNASLPPIDGCAVCAGAGVPIVRLSSTENVSRGARRLYRGVELYPDGSVKKVLLNDPLAARLELHRVRGLHIDRSINLNANVAVPPLQDMAPEAAYDFLKSLVPS
jgi:phage terminase small subunit